MTNEKEQESMLRILLSSLKSLTLIRLLTVASLKLGWRIKVYVCRMYSYYSMLLNDF